MAAKQATQTERRELSAAQQRRLKPLWERYQQAEAALNEFVAYLRDEHETPLSDGWALGLDAFERQVEGD